MDCFVAALLAMTGPLQIQKYDPAFPAGAMRPRFFARNVRSSINRGPQGEMPGAQCTHSLACEIKTKAHEA